MIAPARRAAFAVLRAVNLNHEDLPAALSRVRDSLTDPRDRALTSAIVTGTLRWQGALDHILTQLARRPVSRLDPEVLDILRLSSYQLLHLTRVPASAVVDEGVALTRVARKRSASGLVNAVLRRLSTADAAQWLPPRPVDPAASPEAALDYLSITCSHPRWLAARWLDRLGFDAAEQRLKFNNEAAPLTLRANTLRTSADEVVRELAAAGVSVDRCRYASAGLIVTGGNPLGTDLANSGLFMPQDEASQLVAELVQVAPGMTVLDACASPGGKTTALAAAMQDRGLIVAMDVREARVQLLRHTVRQLDARCVRIVHADAASGVPLGSVCDWALVDAPCSGLGTIRRDPEIRWRRAEADLAGLAAVQRRLLTEAVSAVKPGGHVLYATCSSEPEENEEVVNAIVAARGDLVPIDAHGLILTDGLRSVIDSDGYLRTVPERHGLEAFFGAILRRQ